MDPLAILLRLGGGQTLEDLATALVTTAEEVVATGKQGSVTLKLTLTNKHQGDVLLIIDEVISRASPKKDPRGAVFYAVDGGLYKEDPRQTPLDFRTVDTATGEIRSVTTKVEERVSR